MARFHRIGQTKPVHVYRLCTKDTYEMHMLNTANHKLGLEHAVMRSAGSGYDAKPIDGGHYCAPGGNGPAIG